MRTSPPIPPPGDGERAAYRPTLFDRRGPDAWLLVRMGGQLLLVAAASLLVSMLLARTQGLDGLSRVAFIVAGTVSGTAIVGFLALRLAAAGGALARAVTLPSGASVPYEEQYSYQESLAARGDVAGAIASYEAAIAERPDAFLPRLRAAELCARGGRDPVRAAELFRSVRDLSSAPPREVLLASSRLVDLYDGPLGQPGRALVELRRIVERFPGSPTAEHARRALPGLKARLAAEQGEP